MPVCEAKATWRFSSQVWSTALAPVTLRSERAYRGVFNKAAMGDADNAALIRDQVLHVDIALVGDERGQARGAVFVSDLAQLFFDDCEDALLFCKNIAQILND